MARGIKKPVLISVFGGKLEYRLILNKYDFKFTERDFFSRFWGTEFTVEYPTGKGTVKKAEMLRKLADPCDFREVLQAERAERTARQQNHIRTRYEKHLKAKKGK